MPKETKRAVPPPPKPESELSDAERKQLALLQIGTKEHDFNIIIERVMRFYNSPGWTIKKRETVTSARDSSETYEIVWEQQQSAKSSKLAVRFTANLPRMRAAALVRVLGDDPSRCDGNDGKMYQYDRLLQSNSADYFYGRNLQLNHTTHKAPALLVAAREMHGYLNYLSRFTPAQQRQLNITPRTAKTEEDNREQASTTKKPTKIITKNTTATTTAAEKPKREVETLQVVAQCLIDFWSFNDEHGITSSNSSNSNSNSNSSNLVVIEEQAVPVRKHHVRGSLFHYLVMGQEERDGSLTLTLLIDMDPAGSLPTKLADLTLSEQLKKMKILARLCEEEEKEEKEEEAGELRPYENTREYFPFSTEDGAVLEGSA